MRWSAWAVAATLIGGGGCSIDFGDLKPEDGGTLLDGARTDASADGSAPDDGATPDVARNCTDDADCDDGLFCNGAERCDPGATAADAEGCVPATGPACAANLSCDEELGECLTDCEVDPDADGDGHDAMNCGGDDCDDGDAERFPGNTEVCDDASHDEDCDPATFGSHDSDGDGFVDAACCNVVGGNEPVCGTDCDDARDGVNPDASETCNGADDDCNGRIDEEVQTIYYTDADGDGYGVESSTTMACSVPDGYAEMSGDCADSNPDRSPGETEQCNAIDDDCAGGPDDGFECVLGSSEDCALCGYDGIQRCPDTCSWGSCGGFSVNLTFEGDDSQLTHACGDDCDGVGQDWCACEADCLMQDGPGIVLPPGRYRAGWYIGPSGTDTLTLSIVTADGVTLASEAVTTNATDTHHLEFVVEAGCPLVSFRVHKADPVCARIYNTQVMRLGD